MAVSPSTRFPAALGTEGIQGHLLGAAPLLAYQDSKMVSIVPRGPLERLGTGHGGPAEPSRQVEFIKTDPRAQNSSREGEAPPLRTRSEIIIH